MPFGPPVPVSGPPTFSIRCRWFACLEYSRSVAIKAVVMSSHDTTTMNIKKIIFTFIAFRIITFVCFDVIFLMLVIFFFFLDDEKR